MKWLRVLTVASIAFHVTNCFEVRSPGRESPAIEYQYPIIGGERAPEGSAPYQVSLQTHGVGVFCSGAILNRSWILTAAHCFEGLRLRQLRISSGSNNLKGKNSYHCPDKLFIHPSYDNPRHHNDIALIRLKYPIKWNSRTRPIEIARQPLPAGSKLLISGWGETKPSGNDIPQYLLRAIVNNVPPKQCKELLGNHPSVNVMSNICTSSRPAGTCTGDSGGPVVTVSDKKLVGIVSFGTGCGTGFPDVHANVMFYRNWIDMTIKGRI